jgi:hypothetical protein
MKRLQVQNMIRQLAESNQEKRMLIITTVQILGIRFVVEKIGVKEFLLMFEEYVDGSTLRRSRQRIKMLYETFNLHKASQSLSQ